MSSKAKKNRATKTKRHQILVAYVPVIHKGYHQFFNRFPEVKELWLIDRELAHKLRAFQKDLRALDPIQVKKLLNSWQQFEKIETLTAKNLSQLQKSSAQLIFANDQLSRHLVKKYFADRRVLFDTTFLMWDEKSSINNVEIQQYYTISSKKFDQKMMQLATDEAYKSDEWFRRVGGVIFKNGRVLLKAHNQHVPSEYEAYFEGDPRANFHKGEYFKVSTAIHVEAYLITQAAKQGISLKGADLYVTTFPCPVCAKQVAYSGIKRVFFREGYSVLDGEKVLLANGVKLIKVS